MNQKQQDIRHANVNVNLMVENVTQIKNGIKINITVGANIQEKMCTKKVIFGILLNVLVKIFDMQETLLTIL